MSRVVNSSRKVMISMAFVAVMAASGGLIGSIAGVMLVLLSHVVLGMNMGMLELMPPSVLLGMVTATTLGIIMASRQAPGTSSKWNSTLVAVRSAEQEQA